MKTLTTTIVFFFFTLTAWGTCERRTESFFLIDPIERTPWIIEAHNFRPDVKDHGKFPVIFVMPPLRGENILDQIAAYNFCLHGMGSYILNVVKNYPLQIQI